MFMQMFFSEVHPACHGDAHGIKRGSNQKRMISTLLSTQNCMLVCEIYTINIIAKLDKMAILFYRKIFIQVRVFESNDPLS